jgi:hypothetical protein
MTDTAHWVKIRSFNSSFEAEQARMILEDEEIPALLQGNTVGMFGAGFQGMVVGGVTLSVPSPEVEDAESLLQAAGI